MVALKTVKKEFAALNKELEDLGGTPVPDPAPRRKSGGFPSYPASARCDVQAPLPTQCCQRGRTTDPLELAQAVPDRRGPCFSAGVFCCATHHKLLSSLSRD